MLTHMSDQKATPSNYRTAKGSGVNKAEKMSAAIERVFQGHQARLGSKTLMSIAYSFAALER